MTLFKHKSIYSHLIIALVLAVWLSLFLILIAPFDIAELPFNIRLEIMPTYGLISFFAYLVLIPLQVWFDKKSKDPSVWFEVLIAVLINVFNLIGSYFYYQSSIVNGDYTFGKFALEVYLPIFFILLPMIVFARWFVSRKKTQQNPDAIILKGENKLDILQIKRAHLICISSADNYVDVTYLVNGVASNKLLRTTLKSIEVQFPELVKVHRSHLINPSHFKEWKDAKTLLLTQTEVPVSKNYKKDVLALNHSSLTSTTSPLSQ